MEVIKMAETNIQIFIKEVLENMPADWLRLTTHRLDIYREELAKTEFLEKFEALFAGNDATLPALQNLPTAFDYIRLGHPLSCVLEWAIAKSYNLEPDHVIAFSSEIMPLMAILRKNLFENNPTRIFHTDQLPESFDADLVQKIYGYNFEMLPIGSGAEIPPFHGSTVLFSRSNEISRVDLSANVDFFISVQEHLGSVVIVNHELESYISEIQHVRRRETIAMTPANCLSALKGMSGAKADDNQSNHEANKTSLLRTIQSITGTVTKPLLASSGLSIQYAILMGLIHDAVENHPGKSIKIIVPPNCYGGTNDQARRVAAGLSNVEIVDFPVDAGHDMVQSIDGILDEIAQEDAVPFIIAEIPTNPRVEVPDLDKLRGALTRERQTSVNETAIEPVFILDQTFCPNVHFLGDADILSSVKTISFASGSKFPSGGLCTAGYCVANKKAEGLMKKIERHLTLCDNEATPLQYDILASQMPSMLQRIEDAYQNTREFVNFINEVLPAARINFVSEELAHQGFTPSVFSLDLPTKGDTEEERELYKRELNLKLINLMIAEIPGESKYCVSYGQLKGCYWTIPATSTQGTTKEGDKDYIARVALSGDLDLELHKKVFSQFVDSI